MRLTTLERAQAPQSPETAPRAQHSFAHGADTNETGISGLQLLTLNGTQRVESASLSSRETALGLSGSFSVRSATVIVNAKDSLTAIARKIKLATASVDAMVVTLSPAEYKLVIVTREVGASPAVSDRQGRVLKDLGLLTEDDELAHDTTRGRLDIVGGLS